MNFHHLPSSLVFTSGSPKTHCERKTCTQGLLRSGCQVCGEQVGDRRAGQGCRSGKAESPLAPRPCRGSPAPTRLPAQVRCPGPALSRQPLVAGCPGGRQGRSQPFWLLSFGPSVSSSARMSSKEGFRCGQLVTMEKWGCTWHP